MLSPAAYERLATDGVLRAEPHLVDPDFRDAYDWLGRQAVQRIPGARGCYPIWLWANIARHDLIASFRRDSRFGDSGVLVTCLIERERCLLSAFDPWHFVLNGWWLTPAPRGADAHNPAALAEWERRADREDAAAEARLAGTDADLRDFRTWPADLREDLERSWEHIFEIDAYPADEYWQATVEELLASDVVAVARPIRLLRWRRSGR